MVKQILACLDGSSLAERILPLAQAIASAECATLTILRVVNDSAEVSRQEDYVREPARRFGAQVKLVVSDNPTSAILEELEKDPTTVLAITTHGRTAWSEALLGSVASQVISGAKRPVILYCPLSKDADAPKKINTIVVAVDGSDFSETIIPYAAEMAKALPARLLLVQVLPLQSSIPPGPDQETLVLLESSYLQRKAATIKQAHSITADWEVLHGDPGDAICRYLKDMPNTLLAMTTHARGPVERVMLGSVTGYCVRHSGMPLLINRPAIRSSI